MASHCTNERKVPGGVDGAVIHQPVNPLIGSKTVATETIDPSLSEMDHDQCALGYRCRYSDAAFAELDDDKNLDLGKIAKPRAVDDREVNPAGTTFSITSDSGTFRVGDDVYFVGRTSGWQEARVTETCTYATTKQRPSGRRFVCVGEARVTSDGDAEKGDSGAPVFINTSGNNVRLVGSVFAGSGGTFKFSKLGLIYYELGASEVWNTCTSGC